MGYYIDPTNATKEEFLARNAKPITAEDAMNHSAGTGGEFVVCLFDNGAFTAAGIAYCDNERDAFMHPCGRRKQWFLAPGSALAPYMPK